METNDLNDLEQLAFDQPECCSKCQGELEYIGIGRYKCVHCDNEMLDEYGKLKEYFQKHGSASVAKTIRDTGISREKINIFMNRGTAELVGNSNAAVQKDNAGAAAGRMPSGAGMHYFGRDRNHW